MPLSGPQKKEIMDLLMLSLDGKASQSEMESLGVILDNSDEARDYYVAAVTVFENIRKLEWKPEQPAVLTDCEDTLSREFWQALAEQEKVAPAVEIPKEDSQPRPIQKVVYQPVQRTSPSKLSIATLAFSLAAMLLLMILVKLPDNSQKEVATLQDNLNARWGGTGVIPKKGDRLVSGSNYSLLRDGFVSLLFDNKATVTIEGPAEFEILSADRLKLHYGQIYSVVPQEAIGFAIDTPNSMVIDLGTQFGVGVDLRGNTELHVNDGKTMLISGQKDSKKSQEVLEGAARKVSAGSMEVAEIPCERTTFVRQINSKTKTVWRGQMSLDLADMFCGGNGLGTGESELSINPVTGELMDFIHEDREGSGEYVQISHRRYIDGVFVPDGNSIPVLVSSEGDVFEECPPTNNIYFFDIHKGLDVDRLNLEGETLTDVQIGGKTPPSLMLHANLGMTFDLNAIREDYPLAKIEAFKSWVGVSENANRKANADIWVLVDGEVRYSRKQVNEKGRPYAVSVDLNASDRFLTLVTTDGGDKDLPDPGKRSTDSDWCLFVKPELVLTTNE